MKNLKIEVNTAEESKEAQELLFELGYDWFGKKRDIHADRTGVIITKKFIEADLLVWDKSGGFEIDNHREITLPELRAMVNQEQDEPFLTPETTLNDQYAEIEQVRQTQIGGNHYSKLAIQPMEYSLANGLDAGQHTVIKYVTRFKDKGGIEDLQKAKHTIDLLIANYYGVEK